MITLEELKRRLAELVYPCYFVAHGPARDYRTKFRSEHHGGFGYGMAANADEAYGVIKNVQYPGFYSEMDLIAVSIEDGELKETVL